MTRTKPLIVGFVADLFFTVKIGNVAERDGFDVRWIERAADLQPLNDSVSRRLNQPGENIFGTEGRLFDQLAKWQPALLIFDLGNESIPWEEWIALIKSSPATRRFPVLAFGSHADTVTMEKARAVGSDEVVARSRFVSALPDLIEKHARLHDYAAFKTACDEPLAELAIEGIEAYNRGDYYDAHEDLEYAWKDDSGPGRDLYRAILQIAIAYYQIEKGNYNGCIKMLLRVRQWLRPLPVVCRSVDVLALREDVERVYQAVITLGPERMGEFDWSIIRPVSYDKK